MNRLIFAISFLFLTNFCFGEKSKVDSLNHALSLEQDDFKKVDILAQLSEQCELIDNLKYASSSLSLIHKLKKTTKDTSLYNHLLAQEAGAYSFIGAYYGENNYYENNKFYNSEKSVAYYTKSLQIYQQLKLWNKINDTYGFIDNLHVRTGNSYLQLLSYKSAIEFGKSNNNKIFVARYIYRLATFYARLGDFAKAMQYAEEGVALEKQINDPKRLAKGYELAGDLFARIKQEQKAIEFYHKSLEEYRKNNDSSQNAYVYFGLGTTYAKINNYDEANRYLKQALSLVDSSRGKNAFYLEVIVEIGRLEYQFGNYTAAFHYHQKALADCENSGFPGGIAVSSHELAKDLFRLKKFADAKKYAEKALAVKKSIASVEQIMGTEKLCYKIDSALGNHQSALLHYIEFTKLQNKLNLDEVQKSSIKDDLNKKFEQEKEKEQILLQRKEAEVAQEFKQQKLIRNSLLIGVVLLLLLAAIILRNYFIKKKHSTELVIKNNEILEQKHLIEEKQNEILDSIAYAKRLQHAILPPQEFVSAHLTNNFIFYRPKDIVAGDFYWAEKMNDLFFIAAADSTGHGVPGALVSIVCSNALNRAMKEFNLKETGKILDKTRELVVETFEKSASDVKDGMDISLLCIDLKNKTICWSGANNPLWYIQNNALISIKADKQPIGKTDAPKPFTTHVIELKEATTFYLFTDGLADQFGGPKGKKFKYKKFEELLLSIHEKPMQEQLAIIDLELNNWKGNLEQVDDICVIGIKM